MGHGKHLKSEKHLKIQNITTITTTTTTVMIKLNFKLTYRKMCSKLTHANVSFL